MKKFSMMLLVVLILGSILTACVGKKSAVVNVNEGDAGKLIELSKGDHLIVTLEGNPSTGYTWELVSGQDLLKQMKDMEFAAASQQMVGSGGEMIFEFEAVAAGEAAFEMVYQRPFEPDVDPQEIFSIQLKVK